MKPKAQVVPVIILGLLCVAGAALDYSAVCSAMSTTAFPDDAKNLLDIKHFLCACVAGSISLLLIALPAVAAGKKVSGERALCIITLAFAVAMAMFTAALRAAGDFAAVTGGIDEGTGGLSITQVLFVVIMLLLSFSESVLSFVVQINKLTAEATELTAFIERAQAMRNAIEEHTIAAYDISLAAAKRSAEKAFMSAEDVFLEMLVKAGDLQSDFDRTTDAICAARQETQQEFNEALIAFRNQLDAPQRSFLDKKVPVQISNAKSSEVFEVA